MVISKETKIVNFLLHCFKYHKVLKKALIDHKIQIIPTEKITKPDFFAYLYRKEEEDIDIYFLCEIKKRNLFPDSDHSRISEQYDKYKLLKPEYLDKTKIPIMGDSEIGICYLFFNSKDETIQKIIKKISFNEKTSIFNLKKISNPNSLQLIKEFSEESFRNISQLLIQFSNIKNVENILEESLVLFLPKDLNGITGLGGSEFNINIDLKVEVSILVSELISLILQIKIREEKSNFDLERYLNYIYSSVKGLIYFDDEDIKNIKKKLRMFLNKVIKKTVDI